MTNNPCCRIVVLISGSGSNLQAFIDSAASGELPADIVAVISNRPQAYGLQRASQADIATAALDHTSFASREDFDRALIKLIDPYQPDLIILAGFMRILTPGFVQYYRGRLLNIHPSLLPKYPGLNTHQRAIDAGDSHAGATVHFVTEELDGGPAIVQAQVPIKTTDTAETLAKSVLIEEHRIYPLAATWFAEGKLQLQQDGVVLNGEKLSKYGFQFNQ